MAVTLNNSQISAGLYSAFLNRTPDTSGQNYWVGQLNTGTLTTLQVATAFYNSPEGIVAYPNWLRPYDNLSATDPVNVTQYEKLITQAYNWLFERAPDPTGLQSYVNLMKGGASFPQVIINMMTNALEAGNTDGMQFANEIQVGIYVSEVLRTDDPAITSNALEGVTHEQSSVIAREAELDALASQGITYTLTTTPDNVMGTVRNDLINAPMGTAGDKPLQSLNSFDTIDGGAGIDTLNLWLPSFNHSTSPVLLANVEIVNVASVIAVGQFGTLNLKTDAALQSVNSVGSISNLIVTSIAEGAKLSVINNIAGTEADFRYVRGAHSDVDLLVSDANGSLINISNTSGTVNLTSVNGGVVDRNIIEIGGTGDAISTINVHGSGDLNLVAGDAKLVDARAFTGDLTFYLEQDKGTVIGGSGNDTLRATSTTAAITGGAGADAVEVSTAGVVTAFFTATGQTGVSIAGTFESTANFDHFVGMGANDVLSFIGETGNAFNTVNAVSNSITGQSGDITFVRGNEIGGVFTASATGADTLVVWDTDGSGVGSVFEALVLVGVVETGTQTSAGVITLR